MKIRILETKKNKIMKKIYGLAIGILFPLFTFSQNAKCPYGMNASTFNTYYNTIRSNIDAYQKLQTAKNLVQTNCVSSYQVKELARVLYSDQDRVELCKAAYANTTDQENFYDVYDAFAYFSNVFRLHDYISSLKGTGTSTTNTTSTWPNTTNTQVTYTFPALNYPNHTIYVGVMGCVSPMTDLDFNAQVGETMKKTTDALKLDYLKTLQNTYCITVAQIMKFSLLMTDEKSRLDWFKLAYAKAYDKANYLSCDACLTNSTYKTEFTGFCKTNGLYIGSACSVSETEFESIKSTLLAESFNNTRLTLGKQILEAKKCFTAAQIQSFVKLYDYESSRLEIAKFAYDYCTDKSNYYLVNDAFSFSSSKTDLTNYIQTK